MKFVQAVFVVLFVAGYVASVEVEPHPDAATIDGDKLGQRQQILGTDRRNSSFSTNRLATNGYVAFDGEFPHHAEFYRHGSANGLFYGSLITPNYVLTSASGVVALSMVEEGGMVSLGSEGVFDAYETINFTADGVTVHPFYQHSSVLYDIATVRLNHAATINHHVQPIRLPSLSDGRNYELMEATTFAVAYDSSTYRRVVRYVRNKVMTNADCNLEHPTVAFDVQHICTDSFIGGAFCHRNSGAALTIEDERGRVQIGITRWMNDCDLNYPNLHVRVSTFRDFISMNSDYIFSF
uniref:Peptidase S1 domain-containing protein n=1 Tax=Anopheles farauti TaxID=69004 RepID=A0A182Q7U4_9DIPT